MEASSIFLVGMPLHTCAVECYKGAFQSSPCSRDLLCCTLARNANRRLVICITVRNVHALNQSSAPENLVREACQCLHYLLNFHTVQVLTCVARDCKSVLSNGIARYTSAFGSILKYLLYFNWIEVTAIGRFHCITYHDSQPLVDITQY